MTDRNIANVDVVRGYAAWAQGYDAQDNPMIAALEWQLAIDPLPFAGARVLDVGCGTGRVMARALSAGADHAAGVDGSCEMLAVAARRLAVPLADGRARLTCADLSVPFPDIPADFDLGIITLVLEHAADVAPILAEVANHLAPGALLYVAEIHPDMLRTPLGGHFARDGIAYALPSYPHDRDELSVALGATGFVSIAFDEVRAGEREIAAIPKLAKRAGEGVLLTVRARRASRTDWENR